MKKPSLLQWILLVPFVLIMTGFVVQKEFVPEPVIIFVVLYTLLELVKRKRCAKKEDRAKNLEIVSCQVLHAPLFSNPVFGFKLWVMMKKKKQKTNRLTTGESFRVLVKYPQILKNILKNSFTWFVKMHDIENLTLNFYLSEKGELIFDSSINK